MLSLSSVGGVRSVVPDPIWSRPSLVSAGPEPAETSSSRTWPPPSPPSLALLWLLFLDYIGRPMSYVLPALAGRRVEAPGRKRFCQPASTNAVAAVTVAVRVP